MILVVDDSKTMRQQLRMVFERAGYEVLQAHHGAQGLRLAERYPNIALMIVDINMPVMDGFAMIKAVRKLEAHAETPIFVLTTESSKELADKAKAVGATARMTKPFDPSILLHAAKRMLGG